MDITCLGISENIENGYGGLILGNSMFVEENTQKSGLSKGMLIFYIISLKYEQKRDGESSNRQIAGLGIWFQGKSKK